MLEELVAALHTNRDILNDNDEWTLSDEGTWEEYAKPGGVFYGSLRDMRFYSHVLGQRVMRLLGEQGGL